MAISYLAAVLYFEAILDSVAILDLTAMLDVAGVLDLSSMVDLVAILDLAAILDLVAILDSTAILDLEVIFGFGGQSGSNGVQPHPKSCVVIGQCLVAGLTLAAILEPPVRISRGLKVDSLLLLPSLPVVWLSCRGSKPENPCFLFTPGPVLFALTCDLRDPLRLSVLIQSSV